MSCGAVAQVLFLDDDTIRTWYRLYQQDGFDGLVSFGYDGSACRLSEPQQRQAKDMDHRDAAAHHRRGWRLGRARIRHYL